MLFSLVLLLTNPAGDVDAFVMDHGLTMEDCAPQAQRGVSEVRIGGALLTFDAGTARLICEGER